MTNIYLRWLICLPLYLLVILARYPLAPLAVWLCSSPDRRTLRPWLWWFETIDNDLRGDCGWREQHLIGSDPLSWLNRTRWLWRNGGNALNYVVLGVPAMQGVPGWYARELGSVLHRRWNAIERRYDAWMIRKFIPLWRGAYIEVWLGWAIYGPQHGLCKFVFTIRPRSRAEQTGEKHA